MSLSKNEQEWRCFTGSLADGMKNVRTSAIAITAAIERQLYRRNK